MILGENPSYSKYLSIVPSPTFLQSLEATLFLDSPQDWHKVLKKAKDGNEFTRIAKEIILSKIGRKSGLSHSNLLGLSLWELYNIYQISFTLPNVPIHQIVDQVCEQWSSASILDSIEKSIRDNKKNPENAMHELCKLMSIPSQTVFPFIHKTSFSSLERILEKLSRKIHDTGSLKVAKDYFTSEIYKLKAFNSFKSHLRKSDSPQFNVAKLISITSSWLNADLFVPMMSLVNSKKFAPLINKFMIKKMGDNPQIDLDSFGWDIFSWSREQVINDIVAKRYGRDGTCSIDYSLYTIDVLYRILKRLNESSKANPCDLFAKFASSTTTSSAAALTTSSKEQSPLLSDKLKLCHGLVNASSPFFLEKIDPSMRKHVGDISTRTDHLNSLREYCLARETMKTPSLEIMNIITQNRIRERINQIIKDSNMSIKDKLFNLWDMARRFNSPTDAFILKTIQKSLIPEHFLADLKGKDPSLMATSFDLKKAIIETSQKKEKKQDNSKERGKKPQKKKEGSRMVSKKKKKDIDDTLPVYKRETSTSTTTQEMDQMQMKTY